MCIGAFVVSSRAVFSFFVAIHRVPQYGTWSD
jgi:hypothetical protein